MKPNFPTSHNPFSTLLHKVFCNDPGYSCILNNHYVQQISIETLTFVRFVFLFTERTCAAVLWSWECTRLSFTTSRWKRKWLYLWVSTFHTHMNIFDNSLHSDISQMYLPKPKAKGDKTIDIETSVILLQHKSSIQQ